MIVAEISSCHGGRLTTALELIEAAAEAGADAVKLQAYTPDEMCVSEYEVTGGPWAGNRLRSIYEDGATPLEWFPELFALARDLGLNPFASVFGARSLEALESVDSWGYKIASFELTDVGLIERVASTGKPMFISTGMAFDQEVQEAYDAAVRGGCSNLTLMHCVSAYPTPLEDARLATLDLIHDRWPNAALGLSDHSLDPATLPCLAVALGARVIEKHLCLARETAGADGGFALEPHEFAQMVDAVATTRAALGRGALAPNRDEWVHRGLRRSLRALQDIRKGEMLTEGNVGARRPEGGAPPSALPSILGLPATCEYRRGDAVLAPEG